MFPKDDQQKNLLMAFLLSALVLMGWHFFYAGPKLKEEQERQARLKAQETTATAPGATAAPTAPKAGPDGVPLPPGVSVPGSPPVAVALTREQALAQSPRIDVETPSLKGSIALKGGRIDDLVLVKYAETLKPDSPRVMLFSPAGAPEPYFAEHGWLAADSAIKVPDRDTLWTATGTQALRPAQPVSLTWDNGQGLKFKRTISVDEDYLFSVVDEVENTTAAPVTLHPYARIFRLGTPHVAGFWILHEGLIGVFGEQGLQEMTYADAIKDKAVSKEGDGLTGGWLGITDKYWAASLIPPQTGTFRASLAATKKTASERESFHTSYMLAPLTVAPGAKATTSSHLFAGAKQFRIIERYERELSIKRFDLMIDWGWFRFITKPLYSLIHWLYGLLGNFGLAILATTVIVKGGLFWFANKSYASMAKMKKLQPEMEKIRERSKDDRMAMQQAMMELYKKEKVNPMAGCLPIIPQGFILFALYKVLFITIDARQAPFFGWIKDLSAPDPTSVFNLFGLLPWSPPELLFMHGTVGVWPIVMAATMWVQMQLNPQQPDPIQQKIFSWMPVLFLFIMASFSSGLVIYWAWSNILTLTQQYWIMRKHGADIHLWKNLGVERWINKGAA